jgi:hypothetical protein
MFYVAGIFNAFLGLYVFFEGRKVLEPETANWLMLFFLAFAAVDFYFPHAMKKKWEEDQARLTGAHGSDRDAVRQK